MTSKALPDVPRFLAGMVAIVTGAGGGAKGGIGAGIAMHFAASGAKVVVNDLEEASAMATVDWIRASGGEAIAQTGSVAESSVAHAICATAREAFGPAHVLVNNAGIAFGAAVERLSDADWERVLAVNLDGSFYLSRAVIPDMRRMGFGRIINISSVAGIRTGYLGGPAYTSAKTGVLGLTRHLAVEVAQHGITVNAILPGMTETPLFCSRTSAAVREQLSETIPMGRMGQPRDIAALAVFLASREAHYVTGTALPVDGGLSLVPGDFGAYRRLSNKDTG